MTNLTKKYTNIEEQSDTYILSTNESYKNLAIRLDIFIYKELSKIRGDLSRMYIQKLIHSGYIFENEIAILSSAKKIKLGAVYKVNIPLIKLSNNIIISDNKSLSVIFEDEYLAILNKPPFLTVHSGIGINSENTLAGMLNKILKCDIDFKTEKYTKQYYVQNKITNFSERHGIVHRLDKDTSGLIMVAKNHNMQRILSNMFQKKMIERIYIAIVKGCPVEMCGTIDINIKHSRNNREIMVTTQNGGKNAITHYKTLTKLDNKNSALKVHSPISIIKCKLDTGRTHQIRVHMKHILCPIIGDTKYGIKTESINRQALHSYKMSFIHPITNKKVCIKSSLPNDMKNLLRNYFIK